MASTILVNTIDTQSGNTITVPTGKTLAITDTGALTIGGDAITQGSTNILYKTADYTIVGGDVAGKSEVIVGSTAAAASRTITLPAEATAGLTSTFITVVCITGVASGAAYYMKVQDDSGVELWRGTQKGDFVRIVLVNSLWVVVDHKETFYSHRYLAANMSISSSAMTKAAQTFTDVKTFGDIYDSSNQEIDIPFDCYAHVIWNTPGTSVSDTSTTPGIKVGGTTWISTENAGTNTDGRIMNSINCDVNIYADLGDSVQFYVRNNDSDATHYVYGGATHGTNFQVWLVRRYS